MNQTLKSGRWMLLLLLALACGRPELAPDEPAALEQELSSAVPALVQPGAGLTVLGVTADEHALYQDGQDLYATQLRSGARRVRVASLAPWATPFVLVRGAVAFVWTDATAPTSPLIVYSAKTGARLAAQSSAFGTFAVAASEDGEQVLFPDQVTADGTRGDLVLARTDLTHPVVLLSQVTMGFGVSPCSPKAGFARRHSADCELPVAAFCAPNQTTASLAVFDGAQVATLATGLQTPIVLSSNSRGTRFWAVDAQGAGQIIPTDGAVQVADPGPTGTGFWADDRTVIYAARAPNGLEARRARVGTPGFTSLTQRFASFAAFVFGIKDSGVSPDGSKLPIVSTFDPATGIADQLVLATRATPPQVTVAEARKQTLLCGLGNPFTADSRSFIFSQNVDPTTFLSPLAAFDERGQRIFSDTLGWSCAAATKSLVVFNDHANPAAGTADLKLIDLADPRSTARLVWPEAGLNYGVSSDGRLLAFTTVAPRERAPSGLYVLRIAGPSGSR